jgi:signal transduction histidine kinase
MARFIWKKHPFALLLYLEWILLGISLLAAFSGLGHHPHPPNPSLRHHLDSGNTLPPAKVIFDLGTILSITALGVMGLKLPFGSKLIQGFYIASGLVLSWLAVLLAGKGERVFPALLLVVVIRACLVFPWRGRILVAVLAYASYLSIQIMSFLRISPLGIPLGRPLPPRLRYLPSEELQGILFSLAFNSALLFALVLAFVLLLVGAVLAEHESRAKLITAHRRLRNYALQIENQATLQERNRIAREIHDSVGHYLTAQSIQLENTALFLAQDQDKAASHLQKARQLGKEALANIRSSVASLRKNPLQEGFTSLETILAKLVAEFKLNTNIAIASEISIASSLSTETITALYRIVQEALTNIAKHSRATQASLLIKETAGTIYFSLKDNGCGFNRADNTTGFGLQGMQERTEALNGKFSVISQPKQGCEIVIEIPVLGVVE